MSYVVTPNTYVVSSPADLPAPVGGVIEMPDERFILVDWTGDPGLLVPDQTQLLIPRTSVLSGMDADVSGLRGTVDAPLIVSEPDGGLVVLDLFLRNFSTDAEAFCVGASNGYNPADPATLDSRPIRVERTSVGGRGGVLLEDAAAGTINVLDRCTEQGILLRGNYNAIELNRCVHAGFPPIPPNPPAATPTYLTLEGLPLSLRVNNCVYPIYPGHVGIDASAVAGILPSLGTLWQTATSAFVIVGGTDAVLPSNLPNLPGAPGVFFFGNPGLSDSVFTGYAGFSGNTGNVPTVIANQGSVGANGFITNAVRVGNGSPGHPLFVLSPASARVELTGSGQAQTTVVRWASFEASNVRVGASLSVRSANGLTQSIAAQLMRLPRDGSPAQFITSFTGSTGGLLNSAGFLGPESAQQMYEPPAPPVFAVGDGLAVEIANLGDDVDLIVDSVQIYLEGLD